MTQLLKRDRNQKYIFELDVSLIIDRVISVPLSTPERLPHAGSNSIFPCLVKSFARFKVGKLLKSINAEEKYIVKRSGQGPTPITIIFLTLSLIMD